MEAQMQTFVPFLTFPKCAQALDRQRLGKQRVETLQILKTLDPTCNKRGWINHPAVQMWQGYEAALALYGLAMVKEWTDRGYNDIKCGPQLEAYLDYHLDVRPPEEADLPWWWGDDRVHISHQSRLIQKLDSHYRPLFPVGTPDNLPYFWPMRGDK